MDDKKMTALNDDALDRVAGGTGSQITTCDSFMCVWCGGGKSAGQTGHYCPAQGGKDDPSSWFDYTCQWCEHLYTCSKANSSMR